MQIYADVTGQEMKVARSAQTCALGAAMAGAVAAGAKAAGTTTFAEAQAAMGGVKRTVFKPDAARHKVYRELYTLYRELHDAFGTKAWNGNLLQRHEGPSRPQGPPATEPITMLTELKETVWKANQELAKSGLVILTFGNVSGIDRAPRHRRHQAERRPLRRSEGRRHRPGRPRGQRGRGLAQPLVGHADPPRALQGLSGDRRRRPRPQRICHDVRPSPPRDPLLRDDPRRPFNGPVP